METLMTISKDTVRRERRRSWQRLIGVLVLLAAAGAVILMRSPWKMSGAIRFAMRWISGGTA